MIVKTQGGAVRGTIDNGIAAFRGIPYAAPLHGAARFQAPVAVSRWDGVRDARSFSASVPQQAHPQAPMAGMEPECLTLNIWTPQVAEGGLPVMVWLHGGGFVGGSANSPDFDGTALACDGVVLVTVNYRVGYEGFGWVEDAPCNRGVLDQITALRWVQDNIAAFGGNPQAVTVFGQSAGATSVTAMVASAAANGLFHRAIAQSPGDVFTPVDEAHTVSTMILDELDVRPTAAALADLPSAAIQAVQWDPVAKMLADPGSWTHPHSPYTLVLDGQILDEEPWTAMHRSGSGGGIDLICGFTAEEARIFTIGQDPADADPVSAARGVGLDPDAVEAYRRSWPGIADDQLSMLLASDGMFRMPAHWCAQAHVATGARSTYLYEFGWTGDDELGACHGRDVPFVFGNPGGPLSLQILGKTPPSEFAALSAAMRGAWTSFAATGDPGWPHYRPSDWLTRIWALPTEVRANPTATSASIWERYGRTRQR